MTDRKKFLFVFTVLISSLAAVSCSKWYAKYGISSESELKVAGAIPVLIRAVRSDNCRDSYYGAEYLAKVGRESQEAANALGGALHGSCAVKNGYYLCQFLGSMGNLGTNFLLAAARSPDEVMRYNAVVGMAKLSEPSSEIVALLAEKVESVDPLDEYGARQESFNSLAALGPKAKAALPALMRATTDDTWGYYAIECIGNMRYADPSALQKLEYLAENGANMEIARESLGKLQIKISAHTVVDDITTATGQTPAAKPAKVLPPQPKVARKDIVVAVFDVQDVSNVFRKNVLNQLTIYLMNQVTISAGYRVIPREQLRKSMLDQKGDTYKRCFDASCQIELGRALAAQKMLTTQLLKVGKQCMVVTNMFDLRTETTDKAASTKTDCSETALVAALEDIAKQLAN